MKKYFGADEISSTQEIEYKGNKYVEITFTNGNKITVSKGVFDLSSTDKQNLDLTKMRDEKGYAVVKEILEVLFKWNVKLSEAGYMLQLAVSSLEQNEKKAHEVLWGKNSLEINMLDVDKVLTGEKKTLDDVIGK